MLSHHAELEEFLQSYGVRHDEYCLVHDAVLALYGVRPNEHLELCLTSEASQRLPTKARLTLEHTGSLAISDWLTAVAKPYAHLGVDDGSLLRDDRYTRTFGAVRCARLEFELLDRFAELSESTLQDIQSIEHVSTWPDVAWDWALVTQLARGLQMHRSSGAEPGLMRRTLARVSRGVREPARAFRAARRIMDTLTPPGPLLAPHIGWIPTRSLLALQYVAGEFSRLDVATLLVAAEAAADDPPRGKRLVSKLHPRDQQGDHWREFTALLSSMSSKGFNPRTPILVDSRGNVFDGVRRLAAALHLGLSHVPVRISGLRTDAGPSMSDLENLGLDSRDQAAVKRRLERLLSEEGVYFPVLLWPPARLLFDEIETSLAQFGRVVRMEELTLPWPQFEAFVRTVYGTDDYHQWQIEVKIHAMKSLASVYTFRVVWLELPRPEYAPHITGGPPVPKAAQRLKRRIRATYAPKIEGYVGDVIIHMSDYPHENAVVTRAFRDASGPPEPSSSHLLPDVVPEP